MSYQRRTKLETKILYECCPGWKGDNCDRVCTGGFYGVGCSFACGTCANNLDCDSKTGECPHGCDAGWHGTICKTECTAGSYGLGCLSVCGQCADGWCDRTTGECPTSKCESGWQGKRCDTRCSVGFYGANCHRKCECLMCDPVEGTCPTTTTTATAITTPKLRPPPPSRLPVVIPRPIPTPGHFTTTISTTSPTTSTPQLTTSPTTSTPRLTTITNSTTKLQSFTTPPTTAPVISCEGLEVTTISPPETLWALLLEHHQEIELVCSVTFPKSDANLRKEINWYWGDNPVDESSERHKVVKDWRNRKALSVLLISNVSSCDRGLYTCRGRLGSCEQHKNTSVQCPIYQLPQTFNISARFSRCCSPIDPTTEQTPPKDEPTVYIAITVCLACLLLAVVLGLPLLLYKRWWTIHIWFKYKFGSSEENDGLLYDVYLSFNTDDVELLHFVLNQFRQFLENKGYKVFIFPLDSVPGATQSENIVEAMEQSRRVVILFSKLYRSNEWCRFEFLTAQRLFMKNRLRIVPILYGDSTKDILKDKDFSTVLGSIPIIKLSSTDSLSSSAEVAITMRMPKLADERDKRTPYSVVHINRLYPDTCLS